MTCGVSARRQPDLVNQKPSLRKSFAFNVASVGRFVRTPYNARSTSKSWVGYKVFDWNRDHEWRIEFAVPAVLVIEYAHDA